MKRLQIHKTFVLLAVLFTLAAGVIFTLMGLTYKHLEKVSNDTYWADHSMQVSLKLQKLNSDIKDIETARRNYILEDSEKSKVIIAKKVAEIKVLTSDIQRLFLDNPKQLKNLTLLDALISKEMNIVKETFVQDILLKDRDKLVQSLMASDVTINRTQNLIDVMLNNELMLLKKRRSDYLLSQKLTPVYFYGISLFSLFFLGYAFQRINKEVITQKKANVDLQFALETADIAEKVGDYGIWSYRSPSDSFTYSDNLYRILGFKPQDAKMGFIMERNIIEEDREMVMRKLNLIKNGFPLEPFTYTIKKGNGELRTLRLFAKVTVDSQGDRIVIGTTSDVTDEVQNEKDLENAHRALVYYNESSKEAEIIAKYGFWRWMIKDQSFLFSDNLFKIFGHNPETSEHQLELFLRNIHPNDKNMVMDVITKMENGETEIPTFRHRIFRENDGALRHIQISNKLIRDDKQGDYFLIITQDVTDAVVSQKSIEEKNRVLEAKNRELTAFNYVASHDLQEPLRKIETFLSRLRDKDVERLSESGKQYLAKTELSADRMRTLINDLLQFSRTTRAEQVFEIVDLNHSLQNAIDDLYPQIEETHTKIIAKSLPILKVIPFQIQQLFSNLLSNSIKYRKTNISPEIQITSEKVNNQNYAFLSPNFRHYYKIAFKDNGIGFENKYAIQIFDLFNRLHGKTEYEGTGIGLAICKKIIENHGGYIYAESTPDVGSNFYIFLPVEG